MEETVESGPGSLVLIIVLAALLFLITVYLTGFSSAKAPRILNGLLDMMLNRGGG